MSRVGQAVALSIAVLAVSGCRRSRPPVSRGEVAVVVRTPGPPPPPDLPAVDEREPNGGAAGPMVLTVAEGTPGIAVRGRLPATPADEDAFALEVAGPPPPEPAVPETDGGQSPIPARRLSIEVVPGQGLATALELRDPAGAVVGRSRGTGGQRHGLPNLGAVAGRYQLVISRAVPGGAGEDAGATPDDAYLLVVRLVPFEGGDEREPNDRPAEATPLAAADRGPEAAGFFGSPSDQDHFRVPVGAVPDDFVIAVDLDTPSTVGASVLVLDATGKKVAGARGGKGSQIALRNLAPGALGPVNGSTADGGPGADRHLIVAVRPEGGFDLDRRYVLRVRAEPTPDGEREPNDEPARATPFEGSASGRLGPGDIDVFRLDGGPTPLDVEVTPPARVDVVLELLGADGGRVARADAARRGGSERLSGVAAPPGPVFVRISPKRGDGRVDEPYTLTVRTSPPGDAGP